MSETRPASRVFVVFVLLGLVPTALSCGSDESDSWKCDPGDYQGCDCPAGSPATFGSQTCGDDGTWSACDCVSCGYGSHKSVCAAGEYCCNPSCGLCAAEGKACIMLACE